MVNYKIRMGSRARSVRWSVAMATALLVVLVIMAARVVYAQSSPCQIAKLLPPDIQAFDSLGASIDVTSDIIVSGAPFHRVGTASTGRVYTFRRVDGVWRDDTILLPANVTEGANFGGRVAIEPTLDGGARLVVGASGAPCEGAPQVCGEAFVFVESGGTWSGGTRLIPDSTSSEQTFGWDVDIEGDRVAVGAPESNAELGAAYIFEYDGVSWQRIVRLQEATSHYFGTAVELEGEYLFVGAYLDSELGSNVGAVFVFRRDIGGQWNQAQKLMPSDARPEGRFGYAISASEGFVVIGAPDSSQIDGAAYVFELDGGSESWVERATLTSPVGSSGVVKDAFGSAVDLVGSAALIGAGNYANGAGAAFLFRRSGTDWVEEAAITPTPDGIIGGFGSGVAITDDSLIIGAGFDYAAAQQAGSVNVFLRGESVAGNVNTGDGSTASDVFFVNGSAGNRCNVVNVQSGVVTTLSVQRPPQGNGSYAFWIDDFRRYAGAAIHYQKAGTTYDLGSGVKALPIDNSVAPGAVPCPLTFPAGWTSLTLGAGPASAFCLQRPGFPRAPTSFNVTFPQGNFIIGGVVGDQNSINSPALNVSIANWIFVRSR